jgi:hypothetical protein
MVDGRLEISSVRHLIIWLDNKKRKHFIKMKDLTVNHN